MPASALRIAVFPGDGIGPEIAAATSDVLRAVSGRYQLNIKLEEHAVGHASLKQFGATVRPELLDIVRSADGLILGPVSALEFKDEQSGEINASNTSATATILASNGISSPRRPSG